MSAFDYKRLNSEIREKARLRKEENQVFYDNNLSNLTSGENITERIYDEESLESDSGIFEFELDEFKFAKFNNLIFGCDEAINESAFTKVNGICFYYCDFSFCGFSNIIFTNCSFVGCNFSECYTLGFAATFRECSFISRNLGETNIDDAPSMFKDCELSLKLIDTDISMSVFEKSHFYFSRFERVNMRDTIYLDSNFDTIKIIDCDMRNTKIMNPKFIEFYIEDSINRTKVNKGTFLDAINFNKKEEREVRFSIEVYSQFSELFEMNKLMDLNGEYFFLYKKTEAINLKGISKFKAFMGLITCGYGERPSYSLLTALFLVLFYGTLYMFFGVNINNEVITFRPSLQSLFPPLENLVVWYHFSLVTFSTTGYGNVVPVGGSLLVSAIEMISGVVMVGIWVSTLVRKMVR